MAQTHGRTAAGHSGDTVSDPAQNDGRSGDWSNEGGATASGPATAAGAARDDRDDRPAGPRQSRSRPEEYRTPGPVGPAGELPEQQAGGHEENPVGIPPKAGYPSLDPRHDQHPWSPGRS